MQARRGTSGGVKSRNSVAEKGGLSWQGAFSEVFAEGQIQALLSSTVVLMGMAVFKMTTVVNAY